MCPIRRDWFADGLVEIGLGCGFFGSGWLFRRLLRELAAVETQISAPLTEFLLNLTLVTLVLPIMVILGRRWLMRNRTLLDMTMQPTLNTQLVAAAIGLPVVVAIGIMSALLPRTDTEALPTLIVPLFGLITSLIPLGMALATGHRRFYAITVVVALSGFAWQALGLAVGAAGLGIWVGLGILLLVSGVYGLGRYWYLSQPRAHFERQNDTV